MKWRVPALVAATFTALFAIIGLVGVIDSFDGTDADQVGVIRNGGLLDNREPFDVIKPASGLKWTGMWSTTRIYPATPRPYTLRDDNTADDALGINAIAMPTKDGVTLGVEGSIYTTLTSDEEKLKQFDKTYGARKFVGNDNVARYPSEGDDGWNTFQDAIVQPIVNSTIKVKMTQYNCVDLLTSCALVRQQVDTSKSKDPTVVAPDAGQANVTNLSGLQTAVEDALQQKLGGIFDNITVTLTGFKLPQKAQESIDATLAAWGDANKAFAEAAKNKAKQDGYNACPTCARIDEIEALPDGLTTYAPGSNVAVK